MTVCFACCDCCSAAGVASGVVMRLKETVCSMPVHVRAWVSFGLRFAGVAARYLSPHAAVGSAPTLLGLDMAIWQC